MPDDSPQEIPLQDFIERFEAWGEKYNFQIDPMTAILLVLGVISFVEILKIPREWNERTWVGRAGLLLFLPVWALTAVLWVCLALLVVAIYAPIFGLHVVYHEYQERAFKEGSDLD